MSRILNIRLPSDHWIWSKENKTKIIKDALDLYSKLYDELTAVKNIVIEINRKLESMHITQNNSLYPNQNSEQNAILSDPRLKKSVEQLLDF